MIFAAVDGPIPGSASSCSAVALFRSTIVLPEAPEAAAASARRHDHLLAVRQRRGEIDRGDVGARGRAARRGESVVDTRSRRERVEPGSAHRARDVHDESGRGARGVRHAQRRGERA